MYSQRAAWGGNTRPFESLAQHLVYIDTAWRVPQERCALLLLPLPIPGRDPTLHTTWPQARVARLCKDHPVVVTLLKSPLLGPGPYRKLLPCAEPPFDSLPPNRKSPRAEGDRTLAEKAPKTMPPHTEVSAGVGLVGSAHLWWVGEVRWVQ